MLIQYIRMTANIVCLISTVAIQFWEQFQRKNIELGIDRNMKNDEG